MLTFVKTMFTVHEHISLRPFNTFGIDVTARRLVTVGSEQDLREFLNQQGSEPLLILGEGSNILFTRDVDQTILRLHLKGITLLETQQDYVLIRAAAGENWDSFVDFTVRNGWGGLENLSFIPGTCGASPVQNIGAYGVEVKDRISSVEAINLESLQPLTFSNADCLFDYRSSIFKDRLKDKIVITAVVFKLSAGRHQLITDYGNLAEELEKYSDVTISAVRSAVIAIRRSRLPDPAVTGNAGSFFKNPVITDEQLQTLTDRFPHVPQFTFKPGLTKIPAAWLIEKCGWKGYREKDAGVHPLQPLVLVNYGSARGTDILALASKIKDSVAEKFSIDLDYEVRIV